MDRVDGAIIDAVTGGAERLGEDLSAEDVVVGAPLAVSEETVFTQVLDVQAVQEFFDVAAHALRLARPPTRVSRRLPAYSPRHVPVVHGQRAGVSRRSRDTYASGWPLNLLEIIIGRSMQCEISL